MWFETIWQRIKFKRTEKKGTKKSWKHCVFKNAFKSFKHTTNWKWTNKIIMLMIIICMCYKNSKQKIKNYYYLMCRTSIFVASFLQKFQGQKKCLSQFFAAPRPPYEPFQRIQVPPAESGLVDPKWVDVFPGYKHGDIPASDVSLLGLPEGYSIYFANI